MSSHFAPSAGGTISDLDGWSVQGSNGGFSYPSLQVAADSDEFGFDPVPASFPSKMDQMYTPPDENDGFPDFNFDPASKMTHIKPEIYESGAPTLDRVPEIILNASAAVSRFGQVTPPRSNSEASVEKAPTAKAIRTRRPTKTSGKEEASPATTSGRKRRNVRKMSITAAENPEEDDKRKQSLEKNRLAAAKCRVNKKEKTELLQRDSHEMAVTNAFLKEQLIRMKEEVQQMNALLLSHANGEGCKSPDAIQKHLNELGNEFFTQHIPTMTQEPYDFSDMQFQHSDGDNDSYFSPITDSDMMHPPLPDFDREPDFDVSTPMQMG